MLYLIGGPPKCGKTTLTKKLAQKLQIPWVASDTLEVIAMQYTKKFTTKNVFSVRYPHSTMRGETNDETYSKYTPQEIVRNYIKQAKATYDAIDMFCACVIADGGNYIIEGYHVTPQLMGRLMKKYGRNAFRVVFLTKKNESVFVRNVPKSTTPGDWILRKTKKKGTFGKIAEMVRVYSEWLEKEALRFGFEVVGMDEEFGKKILQIVKFFRI